MTTLSVNTRTVDRILTYLEENGPSKKTNIIRSACSNFYQGRAAIDWMLERGLITFNNDAKCEIVRPVDTCET